MVYDSADALADQGRGERRVRSYRSLENFINTELDIGRVGVRNTHIRVRRPTPQSRARRVGKQRWVCCSCEHAPQPPVEEQSIIIGIPSNMWSKKILGTSRAFFLHENLRSGNPADAGYVPWLTCGLVDGPVCADDGRGFHVWCFFLCPPPRCLRFGWDCVERQAGLYSKAFIRWLCLRGSVGIFVTGCFPSANSCSGLIADPKRYRVDFTGL
ncbi:hypothetical protein HOY80DRAFT_506516 [Tuber brumale]|nr:hypothetical protein HOY80DRAFT_506516 [Tuber brumale]